MSSTAAEKAAAELRDLIRDHVTATVSRHAGRIGIWEVTNEMLNPITSWFATRLGPSIVDDVFHWARQADPGTCGRRRYTVLTCAGLCYYPAGTEHPG